MIKKFFTLITISLFIAACGGGGGTAASGSNGSTGGAAQGYQVPGSFQPVDSEG